MILYTAQITLQEVGAKKIGPLTLQGAKIFGGGGLFGAQNTISLLASQTDKK